MRVPQVAQVYNHLLCQFLFLSCPRRKINSSLVIHLLITMNYENTFRITPLSFTTRTASSSQFLFFFIVAWHQNTLYCLVDYRQIKKLMN
jgi:hypothetical protein